jgi:hypothetical protein
LGLGLWGLRHREAPHLPPAAVEPGRAQTAAPTEQSAKEKEGGREEVGGKKKGSGARDTKMGSAIPPVRAREPSAPATPPRMPAASSADRITSSPVTQAPAPEPLAAAISTAKPAVAAPAGPTRVITLVCRHELDEATLTVTGGGKVILQADLRGKKRRGFVGIRGGFAGILSRPLSVPANAREFNVRIRSLDGSVDLAQEAPPPPATGSDTLEVVASQKRLSVSWKAAKRPAQ